MRRGSPSGWPCRHAGPPACSGHGVVSGADAGGAAQRVAAYFLGAERHGGAQPDAASYRARPWSGTRPPPRGGIPQAPGHLTPPPVVRADVSRVLADTGVAVRRPDGADLHVAGAGHRPAAVVTVCLPVELRSRPCPRAAAPAGDPCADGGPHGAGGSIVGKFYKNRRKNSKISILVVLVQ